MSTEASVGIGLTAESHAQWLYDALEMGDEGEEWTPVFKTDPPSKLLICNGYFAAYFDSRVAGVLPSVASVDADGGQTFRDAKGKVTYRPSSAPVKLWSLSGLTLETGTPTVEQTAIPSIERPDGFDHKWMQMDRCDECNGLGDVTCNYGHEHDCPDCNGTGVSSVAAEAKYEGCETGLALCSNFYLWLAQSLGATQIEIREGHSRQYLWFSGAHCFGVFAAMLRQEP